MITNITDSKVLKAISGGVVCECLAIEPKFREDLKEKHDIFGANLEAQCVGICCKPDFGKPMYVKMYRINGHTESCNNRPMVKDLSTLLSPSLAARALTLKVSFA